MNADPCGYGFTALISSISGFIQKILPAPEDKEEIVSGGLRLKQQKHHN